ncbi:hypothetical protein ANN_05307 [Periplaneta americana]|uniref:Uncharacterized protein n=1 Tax=Periplaneta americana TaxID=6978 RepID=A0ABQ8TBN3_PERAM|nr:hypothetical protein ANN_05307 [Periplaneta americana]
MLSGHQAHTLTCEFYIVIPRHDTLHHSTTAWDLLKSLQVVQLVQQLAMAWKKNCVIHEKDNVIKELCDKIALLSDKITLLEHIAKLKESSKSDNMKTQGHGKWFPASDRIHIPFLLWQIPPRSPCQFEAKLPRIGLPQVPLQKPSNIAEQHSTEAGRESQQLRKTAGVRGKTPRKPHPGTRPDRESNLGPLGSELDSLTPQPQRWTWFAQTEAQFASDGLSSSAVDRSWRDLSSSAVDRSWRDLSSSTVNCLRRSVVRDTVNSSKHQWRPVTAVNGCPTNGSCLFTVDRNSKHRFLVDNGSVTHPHLVPDPSSLPLTVSKSLRKCMVSVTLTPRLVSERFVWPIVSEIVIPGIEFTKSTSKPKSPDMSQPH